MRGIGKGVYHVPIGPGSAVNVYLIEGPDGSYTLVDAAVAGFLGPLRRAMARRGVPLERITRVLLTHAHPDHIGGLPELLAAVPVPVWAHEREAPIVRGEQPVPRPAPETLSRLDRRIARATANGRQPTTTVARTFAGGAVLNDVRPGLVAVHLPGHTAGQSGFWLPDERLLIGGDVAMHVLPWQLSLPLGAFTVDLDEAKRSIGAVAAMEPRTLAVGHGPPLVGNAAAFLDRLVRRVGVSPALATV